MDAYTNTAALILKRLRKQRDQIDHEISVLEEAERVLSRYTDAEPLAAAAPVVAQLLAGDQKFSKPAEVAAAAKVAMSDGPIWVQLPELRAKIETGGLKIAGSDPVSNLSTILSRNKATLGFVSDKRRGWALTARLEAEAREAADDDSV